MANATVSQRPPLPTKDTFDAPRLSGQLGQNGVADLKAEGLAKNNGNGSTVRSISYGTDTRDFGPQSMFEPVLDDDEGSSDAIEDYDDLELDPDTLVANSRKSMDESYRPSGQTFDGSNESKMRRESDPLANSKFQKRNSIQIRLEKTDKKGRYTLTADDPEIREILRKGIEREAAEAGGQKPRTRFRDLVFTRQFTTFDRQNPSASDSPFFGFFTLFWIAMVLIFFQVAMHNYRDYGSILGTNQMMKMMFSHEVWLLGITDGVMCTATAEGFLFQKLIQKGWIKWSREGWIIQNLWQSAYLGGVVGWAYFREWPWTHTIFAVLHGLVFVMKQHSYAFYNGYLSTIYRRRALLERKLDELDQMEPARSPPASPVPPMQNGDYTSGFDRGRLSGKSNDSKTNRRPSMRPRAGTDFTQETSDVAGVASAIQSGKAIDTDQMKTFENVIQAEIDDLTRELQGKSPEGRNAYPKNLTLYNFFDYICLPTLVYELEYPRQERTNWWYVLEKTTATFGVLCVMMVISQAFIYPPVAKNRSHERGRYANRATMARIPIHRQRYALPTPHRAAVDLVPDLGMHPQRPGRSDALRGSRLLRRLVELRDLGSIRS